MTMRFFLTLDTCVFLEASFIKKRKYSFGISHDSSLPIYLGRVMEVAGSLIAIGQAAAAIPLLVDAIRTFADIKSDLLELHNEVC